MEASSCKNAVIPRISLCIINYGTPNLVDDQLSSLASHPDLDLIGEVLIINNGFPAIAPWRPSPNTPVPIGLIHVFDSEEHSYSSGGNLAIRESKLDLIAIANSDLLWSKTRSINPLVSHLDNFPTVGIVGPQLYYPDGQWQRSYGQFPSLVQGLKSMFLLDVTQNALAQAKTRRPLNAARVDYVDGAFMMIRRNCANRIRGFDETYQFYAEDADLCRRALAAEWPSAFVPSAGLIHIRGASSRAVDRVKFFEKLFHARLQFLERDHPPLYRRVYGSLSAQAARNRFYAYCLLSRITNIPKFRLKAEMSKVEAATYKRALSLNCVGGGRSRNDE